MFRDLKSNYVINVFSQLVSKLKENASTNVSQLALKLIDIFFSKEELSNSNCMEVEEESYI